MVLYFDQKLIGRLKLRQYTFQEIAEFSLLVQDSGRLNLERILMR